MLNLLVAYPYMKPDVVKMINANKRKVRFLLDSGAFTAWKAGKMIELDDYCMFIEKLPFKPWRYFTLDKVGDPEGSLKNYELMIKRGFNPVPIFTRGENPKMIDEYYKSSDVVGIGGLVGTQGNKGFVKAIMKVIGTRKVHWLGFVRHDYVNFYKPYMCDASSWSHASRNGDLKLYIGQGKIKSIRRGDFMTRPDPQILRILNTYGISQQTIASNKFWTSWRDLNQAAAQMWVRRSIESEKFLKTYLFLACATIQDIEMLLNGFQKEGVKNASSHSSLGRNGFGGRALQAGS